jgi:hypothetical protein
MREHVMSSLANPRVGFVCVLFVLFSAPASSEPASPPTASLAKKCREMTVKAYPPVPAGSKKGTAGAERDYFKKCIDAGGKI